MMNINIKATGIEMTPAISSYAEKKISSIEKYIEKGKSPVVQMEVGKNTKHHKEGPFFRAEVKIVGLGKDVYAVCEAEDLYAAIDMVRDEVVQEITRDKSKRLHMMRKGGRMVKDIVRGFPWVRLPKRFRRGEDIDTI
ncbi:ribosome-associated translation inhibitor RaiA [Candidatus Parcubacteria bacterium]|nr:ribosome-associated translation inhibitor RaiA [Candidatus Parcubacteria bacterium]